VVGELFFGVLGEEVFYVCFGVFGVLIVVHVLP
jgi:hypothetical protein